jgi:hypothetical protein
MSQVQFGELLRRVEELVTWDKGVGRPRGLTLTQGLKATLMYFKNNITEEVIAELLFVSQSVISETCGYRTGHPHHATWEYSWISPPSRSRRRTRSWEGDAGGGSGWSGAAWFSVR